MATPVTEQYQYAIGLDDPSTTNDPNSVSWSGQASGRFHLRFQIAETAGGNYKSITFAVFCNTTNDPSTAFQVTTNGSGNMEPVEITNSIGGADLADGTAITSSIFASAPPGTTWVDGYYIDASDQFPVLAQLISQYTELQACITFTGYASYGTTYYFWIKQSDGSALDTYTEVAQVTPQQPYSATKDTSWGYLKTKTKDTAWSFINHEILNSSWSLITKDTWDFAWRHLAQTSNQAAWEISITKLKDAAWATQKHIDKDAAWQIVKRTFDVEWRESGTTELLGSDTGIEVEYYDVTGLSSGLNYEWRVRSVENGVPGVWSNWKTFTTISVSGTLRADVSWKTFNIDSHELAWGIQYNKEKVSAWAIRNTETQETAWELGTVLTATKDISWKLLSQKDITISWEIERPLNPTNVQFLLKTNLGEGMIHKLTAGLGQEMFWSLPMQLSEGRSKYANLISSIAGEPVNKYHLLLQELAETDDLRKYLNLLTSLGDLTSFAYSISAEVYLDGRPLSQRATNFRISYDETSVHNEIRISSHDPELFAMADPNRNYGEPRIEVQVGSRVIQFLLESREGERSNFSLTGRSVSAKEDAPYATDIDFEMSETTFASVIAASLTTYCAVVWDVEDWPVPDNFTFSGKPLDGIQKLATEIGAIVRCQDDGSLLIRRRRPVRPIDVDEVSPDIDYTQQTLMSLSHTEQRESGYNAVVVFGTASDEFMPQLVLEDIEETDGTTRGPYIGETCNVRVYWAGKLSEVQATYVTDGLISPDGPSSTFHTETVEETVEFENGSGSVNLPVYELVSYSWIGDSAGSIEYVRHSTDLTIPDPDITEPDYGIFRIAKVKYKTRFQRYALSRHNVERLLAVLFLAVGPDINVRVRTAEIPVYGSPIESSLLMVESAAVERAIAWIDQQYRKSLCDIVVPYNDAVIDGNLMGVNDAEIGYPGNYHIISSDILIEGPSVTNTVRVEKCLTSFNS